MKKASTITLVAIGAIALLFASCKNNSTATAEVSAEETNCEEVTTDTTITATNIGPAAPYSGVISVKEIREMDKVFENYTDEELDCSGFVVLCEYIPEIIQEIRYFTTYNFVGRRVDGYYEPYALATKEMADSLKSVSDELLGKGYRLRIFDTYRPDIAVKHFVRWAKDLGDTLTKVSFYPELNKNVLFKLDYISSRSGHSRGSTVDLTLFDIKSGKDLDMGGTFDYFGELSHPDYKDITPEQKANRTLLREAMLRHGFRPLYSEWWHFTLKNEPYPETYFSFPVMNIARKGR